MSFLVFCICEAQNPAQLDVNFDYKDNVSLMLQSIESLKEDVGEFFQNLGASLTMYIEVENVDELYLKIKDKVTIYKEIETTWYGQKEFYIKDINGYILGFASKVQEFN